MPVRNFLLASILVASLQAQPAAAAPGRSDEERDNDFNICIANSAGYSSESALWDQCYKVAYGDLDGGEGTGIVRDPGGMPDKYYPPVPVCKIEDGCSKN